MAMNLGGARRHAASADINITPLIDVVLVLLIIFMVLLPSTMKQLTATLPRKDDSAAPAQASQQVVIRIGPQSQLTLDDRPVEASALRQRISERLAGAEQKVVFFEIDDEARYEAVVRVMDLAKGGGARTLAIVSKE